MVIKNKLIVNIACLSFSAVALFPGQPAFASGSSLGPSFDCSKASTKVELAICSDSHLSAMDLGLSKLYKAKRAIPALRGRVKKSQLEWLLTERIKCEKPGKGDLENIDAIRKGCLESAYRDRREALNLLEVDPLKASGKPPIKFKLMTGGQYPLCRDYVDMLNQAGYVDAPICERKIISSFSKFKAVRWAEVVDKEEIKRIKREQIVMERLWSPKLHKKTEEYWLWVESEMESGGWPVLHKARVDIDHDGQDDSVYRFKLVTPRSRKYGKCDRENSYFIIYDRSSKTRRVYKDRKFTLDGPPDGAHEIFYYEGRAFQDFWNGWTSQYQLKVNELSGIANQVCGINMVQ